MAKTKPCPFCASANVSIEKDESVYWIARCENCGAVVGASDYFENWEEALEKWNRRAQESEKDEH